MKALKIIAMIIIVLIVGFAVFHKQIGAMLLYAQANEGREKRGIANATKADILGPVTEMKLGSLIKCNKYLSMHLPESFTAELTKEVKKQAEGIDLNFCILRSVNEEGKSIFITDSTKNFKDTVDSVFALFKETESSKISFYDAIAADLNKSPRLFDRILILRESATRPLHPFAFEENIYANFLNNMGPIFDWSTYQEVGDYKVALMSKQRAQYLIFTPDNKSFRFEFSKFKDDEIAAYLKSVMKEGALAVDEINYKKANEAIDKSIDDDLKKLKK